MEQPRLQVARALRAAAVALEGAARAPSKSAATLRRGKATDDIFARAKRVVRVDAETYDAKGNRFPEREQEITLDEAKKAFQQNPKAKMSWRNHDGAFVFVVSTHWGQTLYELHMG